MKSVLLTPAELDLLLWAVDGAESAHLADPDEFPKVPDGEDLEYRIREQAPEAAETNADARAVTRVGNGLLAKLSR